MNGASIIKKISANSALVGAVLVVLTGLLLWGTPLGEPWENASYDCQYRFGVPAPRDQVVLLTIPAGEDKTFEQFDQRRRQHAAMLDRLTADQARLAVFDIFFETNKTAATDARLAAAMRTNGRVVLMVDIESNKDVPDAQDVPLDSVRLKLPYAPILAAAASYGVGHAEVPECGLVRRHWPGLSLQHGETNFHSLGWAAAALVTNLDATAQNQWLRYYGKTYFGKNYHGTNDPGRRISYTNAMSLPAGFFSNKVVFIGGWPQSVAKPSEFEEDKFSTPYTSQTRLAVGGIEINATTFLNLVNGDWLRRPPAPLEFFLLVLTGILLGGGLCRLRPLPALLVAVGIFFAVLCIFVSWSFYSNYWFPWLVIAGGQLPLALAWSWAAGRRAHNDVTERHPGYVEVSGTFGEGSFGNVRVVRNATGQLQALKEVVLAKFENADPYEREFRGIKNYKPFSSQHPGLLHVDYVNRNEEDGYFFYVMELGDAMEPGWEQSGVAYKPRDLHNVHRAMPDGRLPVRECLRIGIVLLDALDFLHQHGLVHRDIKPANIVFINGQPKLADVGLVRDVSPGSTMIGTPDFMPPPMEPTGTKTADIYALGKVLYVISTGKNAKDFSEISTTLVAKPEFMRLNEIICCAAHPLADQRYASAAEMLAALRAAQAELDGGSTQRM